MTTYPLFETFGGEIKKIRRLIDPENKRWSAFNPSIAYAPKQGIVVALRSSNYIVDTRTGSYAVTEGNKIRNRVYFANLTKDFKLENIREIEFEPIPIEDIDLKIVRGAEDAKPYWRDNKWEFTAVLKEPYGIPIPRLARFQIVNDKAQFVDLNGFIGEDVQRAEKNWMTSYDVNPNFDYIYSPTQIIKHRELITVRDSHPEAEKLRGGSNLWQLEDGTYLAITHKTHLKNFNFYDPKRFGIVKGQLRNYEHRFARYSNEGVLIELSQPFQFISKGIEFAAGLIIQNGKVMVSFGKDDVSSHIGIIPLENVLEMLKKI